LGSSTAYTCTYTDTTVAAQHPRSVVRFTTSSYVYAPMIGFNFSATAVMPPGW
jgi:hypothetical protein